MTTKRMPTAADGITLGADATVGFFASLVDVMMRKGCSIEQVRAVLYACADDSALAVEPISALALRHVSSADELSDDQLNADFVVLVTEVCARLRARGLEVGFVGPVVARKLT